MTPQELNKAVGDTVYTLASLYSARTRTIPRDKIAAAFPAIFADDLPDLLDHLESLGFLSTEQTLEIGLPLEITILPTVISHATQPPEDEVAKLKTKFLSYKIVAIPAFILLTVVAILGVTKAIFGWP